MSLLRLRIRDDRGRKVAAPLPPRVPFWLGVIAFGLATACFMRCLVADGPRINEVLSPAGVALMLIGHFLLLWAGADRSEARRCRLWQRKCVSCEYPLSELAAEPDGCTVCPECGAAWKLKGATQARSREGTKETSE